MKLIRVKFYDIKISKFIFTLRNKNYVRKNSINTKKLKISEHKKWFDNFLKKKNIIYIISKKKIMIGYIRLEKIKNFFYVSWAILKKYHNMGFAKKGLGFVTKTKTRKYKALIKKNNLTSIHIAEKANFKRKYVKENILYYFK